MREYVDCYKDYCVWVVKKSGNELLSYTNMLREHGETTAHAYFYKTILKLCCDKKDGIFYFCKFIVGDLMEIGYPRPFRFNKLLRTWDNLLKKYERLSIQASRGYGKTVFFSEILNIYDMFLVKHMRVIIVSASQEQSNRILEEIKTIVDNNEWLSTKKNKLKWANTSIGYNGGYIIAVGVGVEILGQHINRIILDDVLRNDNKIADQDIEDYVDFTIEPMMSNRDGQIIIVGTGKSPTDIFHVIDERIRETPACPWKSFKYPAILDYEKKITLAPDRFTWDKIMKIRLTMGPLKFAREYQLELFSRDTSLFPDALIKRAKERGKDCILMNKIDKRTPNWVYLISVDVARSGSASADYTVAIVLAYDTIKQTKQIVHFWRAKGLKISEQAKKIAEISKAFNNPMTVVEQNNMGQDMIDELVDKHNLFVDSVITGGITSGRSIKKEELIRFLITAFEHEQFIIPMGDEESVKQMGLLVDELKRFCVFTTPAGNEQYKGIGHDDIIMSLAIGNRGTQNMGIPFAMGSYRDGPSDSNSNPYQAIFKNSSDDESDLVKMIKAGIIR